MDLDKIGWMVYDQQSCILLCFDARDGANSGLKLLRNTHVQGPARQQTPQLCTAPVHLHESNPATGSLGPEIWSPTARPRVFDQNLEVVVITVTTCAKYDLNQPTRNGMLFFPVALTISILLPNDL